MLQKSSQQTQISKGRDRGISSSCFKFNASPLPFVHHQSTNSTYKLQQQIQDQSQSNPPISHLHFHHEKPIFSAPHKRPAMMIPQSLSHSPTLSSLHIHHQSNFNTKPCLKATSFSLKNLASNLFLHITQTRLICVHLRVLILISLPSLYLLISNPHCFFFLIFLFIIAFSITLLISLNFTLPSLSHLLPNKFKSTSLTKQVSKRVIWSIGSKPRVEKKLTSGSWVEAYSNGDVYEGEFHKGKCSGSGVYYYYRSGRYEGDWIDENYDGYGVETWARGSRYRGQYRHGLRHGIGVYRFFTGDVYAGEWYNGQCHGCGIHTREDGSKYVGEFKCGVKHGLGHYHFRNGDTYAGEYFADKMHGFGVYQFGNGHRYEGSWHEGRRQGPGTYTFRNAETQSGHWQNGVLDVPAAGDSNPVSPNAVGHFKVLHAVQEAKRAAEKAYHVARIEEMVNKAIAAANKAANAARVAAVKAVQERMRHTNCDDVPISFV